MVKKCLYIFTEQPNVCEAMVVLLCVVDEQWNIQQHGVQLILAKSLTGEEVAHQLIIAFPLSQVLLPTCQ